MNASNVEILRAVYCLMVVKNLEPQLDPRTPLPREGFFFSTWGERFCVRIVFGVPGCGDFEYSAQLTVYVPTETLGQITGDVFLQCVAVSGEGLDVPIRMTMYPDVPETGSLAERATRQSREETCRFIAEEVYEYARQARVDLQKDARLVVT